ncbi:hypothetical protein VCHA54P500_120101 [Vibrio chagasii]|nr:hypothetical protein VCHA34P117_190063 [Vibrio chagasii]CAH6909223.1 hypothetical protein VCHA48P439_120100 [Vibrio chagasii]CAH6910198.1 hypothetical protein VCHA40O236_120063 [Vibrio chagasii]CAH6966516.1 hypothetical protein VCHA54P500_120101 [Vibrio chagasii]CAH7156298.1 hypothetical protein VCHA53O462_120100 [Vibrio chagasii]
MTNNLTYGDKVLVLKVIIIGWIVTKYYLVVSLIILSRLIND